MLVSELLLISAVAAVGVLHTIVPDHWLPITIVARQRGWSKRETAAAALQAGTGHVLSTVALGLVVWIAGLTVANRFGKVIDTGSSVALVGFGLWIAISSWCEQHHRHGHEHSPHSSDAATRQDGRKRRTALLLILGSSPMVEAIPAFFAASKFGMGMVAAMTVVFGATTIATYTVLCVASLAGLDRLRLGALEQYAEVLSGAAIAAVGVAFWIWPVL